MKRQLFTVLNCLVLMVLLLSGGVQPLAASNDSAETFDLEGLELNTYTTDDSCSACLVEKLKFSPGECIGYKVHIQFDTSAPRHITIIGVVRGEDFKDFFREDRVVDSWDEYVCVCRVIPATATAGWVNAYVLLRGEDLEPPCEDAKAIASTSFLVE